MSRLRFLEALLQTRLGDDAAVSSRYPFPFLPTSLLNDKLICAPGGEEGSIFPQSGKAENGPRCDLFPRFSFLQTESMRMKGAYDGPCPQIRCPAHKKG